MGATQLGANVGKEYGVTVLSSLRSKCLGTILEKYYRKFNENNKYMDGYCFRVLNDQNKKNFLLIFLSEFVATSLHFYI